MVSKRPQPLISDEFWRLAHHHATGRALLQRNVMNLGLAASVVADLLIGGHVAVHGGWLEPQPHPDPKDPVLASQLLTIRGERSLHPLSTWLDVLADTAHDQIAHRLHATGQLRRTGLLSRRWEPTDINTAGWTSARLRRGICDGTWFQPYDPILAALAWATGMDRYLLDDTSPDGPALIEHAVRHLRPPFAALVHETHATVGRAVVTHRA